MEGRQRRLPSSQALLEKGDKIEKTFNDFRDGKMDQEEFARLQKEQFDSILEEEPWLNFMFNMDSDKAILLGNLMNKKHEREGKPLLFSGPEVPVPDELLEAVCKIPSEDEEEDEEEEDIDWEKDPPRFMYSVTNNEFRLIVRVGPVMVTPTLQSIWGKFGETDSGSEGEY